jgi:deoxyadenosine/deoxycytidine kinase
VTLADMMAEVRDEILRSRGASRLLVAHPRVARPYVAVVGSIGVGKSTLVRLLGERADWTLIPEPVEENPYLSGAYADLEGLALRVQAFYLGGRTRQHMKALEVRGPAVQDRCLYEDTEVFARTYHELGAFNSTDLMTLENLYEALADLLPRPDLLVYVHAPLGVTMKRIAQRGRDFEQSMDAKLIVRLTANYERWIDDQRWAPVVKVDSSAADYASDSAARQDVLARVDRAIAQAMSGRTVIAEPPTAEVPAPLKRERASVEVP